MEIPQNRPPWRLTLRSIRFRLLFGYTLLFGLAFAAAAVGVYWLGAQELLRASAGLDAAAQAALLAMWRERLLPGLLLVFGVAYALGALSVSWLAGRLGRPLARLAELAQQVGEGRYDLEWDAPGEANAAAEIDRLAQALRAMAENINRRQQFLEEQVRALRIEIDEAKTQQTVKEITETEFFQGLATWAEGMRARRKRGNSIPPPT